MSDKQWELGDIITPKWMNDVDAGITSNQVVAEELDRKVTDMQDAIELNKVDINGIKPDVVKALAMQGSLDTLLAEFTTIQNRFNLVEQRLAEASRKDQQRAEISNDNPNVDRPTESIFVNTKQPLEKNGTIKGKQVELGAFHLMGGTVTVEASGDVNIGTITSVGEITDPAPEAPVALHIKSGGHVDVKRALMQSTGAIAIRVGAHEGKAPKSISLNGLDFSKPQAGPAVYIDNIAQDGIITISNSIFLNISNILELVSNTATNRFKLFLNNCRIAQYTPGMPVNKQGLVVLRDTDSKNMEDFKRRKVFGPGICDITVVNSTIGGRRVEQATKEVMFGADGQQLVVAYAGKDVLATFDGDATAWPSVTVK